MSATGAEIKFGARKAAVWGTPVALGANTGFLITPSDYKKDQPFTVDDSLGLGWPTDGDLGEIKVDGNVKGYVRYDSLDLMIAMAMGAHSVAHTVPTTGGGAAASGTTTTLVKTAAGWAVDAFALAAGRFYATVTAGTNSGVTRRIISNTATQLTFAAMPVACDATTVFTISGAASTHVYTMAENTDGQFISLCAKIGALQVDEITTAKVAGFTITGGTGKPLGVAFKIIAHGLNKNTTSGTNDNTTILTVTFPETANRVLYKQLKFLINAGGGADFTDSDYPTGNRLYPASFTFAFDRNLKGVYGVGGSTDNIDEPTNDGNPTVSLDYEVARHTAQTLGLITAHAAGTAQKIKMVFTGLLLSGATYRALTIEIPNAKFSAADVPMKAGTLSVPFKMFCMGKSAAPTGMANLTAPFRLTLVNQFGGDVLQEAIA